MLHLGYLQQIRTSPTTSTSLLRGNSSKLARSLRKFPSKTATGSGASCSNLQPSNSTRRTALRSILWIMKAILELMINLVRSLTIAISRRKSCRIHRVAAWLSGRGNSGTLRRGSTVSEAVLRKSSWTSHISTSRSLGGTGTLKL